MNDRFKFRCWDKENKKFLHHLSFDISPNGILILFGGIEGKKYLDVNDTDRYVLMQCTGLKDSSRRLIYEGDIVKCGKWDLAARDSFRDDEYIEQVGVINYYNNRCRFVVNRTTIASPIEISLPETCLGILGDCHIEVIGNIYEDKELLE